MNRKRSLPQQAGASSEKKPKLCFYLEDNTPVRTIEVSSVPTDSSKDCSEEFIRTHFERIGPVEHVEIAKGTTDEWLAYVTFMRPEDAAALIHNKDVTGNAQCSKFAMKIADDAHQIKIEPNVLSLMENVNDHCLLHIMCHLSLIDVINLSRTSKRMRSVSEIYYKTVTKLSFRWEDREWLKRSNLPVILEAIGDRIRWIDWYYLSAAQFRLLVNYCPNVKKLKINFTHGDFHNTIDQSKGFFKNLEELYIVNLYKLLDVDIRNMMSGEKLKTLHIKSCMGIRGNFFTETNHGKLKNVKIIDCTYAKKEDFNFHKWNCKLTTFATDIRGYCLVLVTLPTETLEWIEELRLNISCFIGVTPGLNLSGLKRLKKFSLDMGVRRINMDTVMDTNSVINELSQIVSLESLTLRGITIDTNTIQRSPKNIKCLKMYGIDNRMGTRLYAQIRKYLPTLRELSSYNDSSHHYTAEIDNVMMGKVIIDIIAGMPMLNFFYHSAFTWEWLDGIRQTKSITALDEKKLPLRIGVPPKIFCKEKKEAFEAIHKGAITFCEYVFDFD